MHTFKELYKIQNEGKNHIYTFEAVKDLVINNSFRTRKAGQAYTMRRRTATPKPFRIYNSINSKDYKLGYQYGESIWFDTEEELENYRAGQKILQTEKRKENAKMRLLENIKILEEEYNFNISYSTSSGLVLSA